MTFFGVKSTKILCKLTQFFFFICSKIKYFLKFVIFVAKKKVGQQFFPPPLLLLMFDPVFGIVKNQDPGSGINIPDPQHCLNVLNTSCVMGVCSLVYF